MTGSRCAACAAALALLVAPTSPARSFRSSFPADVPCVHAAARPSSARPPVDLGLLPVSSGAHVTVRYRADLSPAAAAAAVRDLEEGWELIRAALGIAPAAPVEVLLLAPAAFRALSGSPPWVRGAYDGRIAVPTAAAPDAAAAGALRRVLLHELTHAFLRSRGTAELPPWFEEGLAERFEGNTPQAAATWLRERRAPAFAGLDALDADIRAGGWREDAGHQRARIALEELERGAGADAPARVLAAVRAGSTPARALELVVPGGAAAIESRLRARAW